MRLTLSHPWEWAFRDAVVDALRGTGQTGPFYNEHSPAYKAGYAAGLARMAELKMGPEAADVARLTRSTWERVNAYATTAALGAFQAANALGDLQRMFQCSCGHEWEAPLNDSVPCPVCRKLNYFTQGGNT